MIEESDLRIGNYLFLNGKSVFITEIRKECVVEVSNIEGIYNVLPIQTLQPITITEDILFKCGFILPAKYEYTIEFKNLELFISLICIRGKWNVGLFSPYGLVHPKRITYFHELQNLIFSLTGKKIECLL
jgi:hypothetical protein